MLNREYAGLTPTTYFIVELSMEGISDIKKIVITCSEEYIANINAAIKAASNTNSNTKPGDEGEQGRLNKIIAALDFD